jgi:hypothetical protein
VHNDNDPSYILVTPDSDEDTDWDWEDRARDGDTDPVDSYARYNNILVEFTDYLILTMYTVIPCSGFRINAKYSIAFEYMEVIMYNGNTQVKYTLIPDWSPTNTWY